MRAHICVTIGQQKRDIATEALGVLFEKCYTHNVDIIGCDLNQAVALRKSHTTSPLFEAMRQFCSKHDVTSDYPYVALYGQNPNDCCGFIIMPTSSIYAECVVKKHSWAPFVNTDFGLRKTDGRHIIQLICGCVVKRTSGNIRVVTTHGISKKQLRRGN